jgi:hypothetical protein
MRRKNRDIYDAFRTRFGISFGSISFRQESDDQESYIVRHINPIVFCPLSKVSVFVCLCVLPMSPVRERRAEVNFEIGLYVKYLFITTCLPTCAICQ